MRAENRVTFRTRLGATFVGLASVWALAFSFGAGEAQAVRYDRTCGELPGYGAYHYVRAKNTTCARAWKVTRKAWKKFCGARNMCYINPYGDITKVHRGKVRRNGWRCKVASGWEMIRVKCRKGKRLVIWRTGA